MAGLSFRTTELDDARLRAAAETIDKHVGRRGDREVTEGDLGAAERMLREHKAAIAAHTPEKSPLKDLHPVDVRLLDERLLELKKFLHGEKKERRNDDPFCTSLWPTAISDDGVRETATAIAKALAPQGKEGAGEELSLADFLDARDVLRGKKTDKGPEETERVKKALQPFIDNKTITEARMDALDVFFLTGQGGLMTHGPIRITGRVFEDVYRLPRHDAKDDKDLAKVIDGYETMFKNTGYDRIYIKGENGELFVALNEHGNLEDVGAGYRVSMRNEHHQRDSGEVLRVVDVANSLKEASIGLWKKTVRKLAEVITSSVTDKLDKTVEDTAKVIVDGASGNASKAQKTDLRSIVTTAALVAAVSGIAVTVPKALLLLAVAGGLATVTSVAGYMLQQKDKSPILHAMGVTVNRPEAQWY